MSYRVEDLVDERLTFEEGSNLLLTGASPLVTERLYDALGDGIADGESIIVISTDAGPEGVVAEFERRDDFPDERIGIIDSTGEGAYDGPLAIRDLGSPGDLTGMSLEFAKLSKQLAPVGENGRLRIGLATVSTLLMYADVRTVFRFLHVFTSRIRSAGMFGVFAMDPEMHDDQTTSTVRAVFNAEARVTDEGVTLRGTGFERE